MKKETASQLIDQVRSDYNRIADHFAQTRSYQWYEVQHLLEQYVQPGQTVLDVGCANGRLADVVQQIKGHYTGVDLSDELIRIATQQRPWAEFHVGNMTQLPFANNSFDYIFAVASFHHLPDEDSRVQGLLEMKRVVKPGGHIILTNWNLHQWKFSRLRRKFNRMRLLRKHEMGKNDVLVPWKNQDRKILAERYYHGFTKKELNGLAKKAGLKIEKQYYETRGLHVPRRKGQNIITILSQ